jgi:hypothetical protein
MLCSLTDGYQYFEWTWCLHIQESYQTTGHHITEPIGFILTTVNRLHVSIMSHNIKLHSPTFKSQLCENLICKVCREENKYSICFTEWTSNTLGCLLLLQIITITAVCVGAERGLFFLSNYQFRIQLTVATAHIYTCIPTLFLHGFKRLDGDDHWPPSVIKFKNEWSYTSVPMPS